jgi:hypothetical protein
MGEKQPYVARPATDHPRGIHNVVLGVTRPQGVEGSDMVAQVRL